MITGDKNQDDVKNRFVYHAILPITVILFLGLSWYIVIRQTQGLAQAAITAYQQTELEIVRTAAHAIEQYVYDQVNVHGRDDIDAIEQEIFTQFIAPIRLLENGDAWIYTPDYVVFDRSSDFPDKYRGKNMAEIFALQANLGASHYAAMTDAVMHAREGTGWYIWLPDKGKEIATWTPIKVGEYTWIIGLSTPLPEILTSTGAQQQIQTMVVITSLASILTLALLAAWGSSALQRQRIDHELRASQRLLGDIFNAIQDGITVLDRDLTILHVNHAMEQQHPHATPLVGKKCFAALLGRSTPCEGCTAIRAIERKQIQTDVMAIAAHGDSQKWIEIHAYPLFDTDTKAADAIKIRGVVKHTRNVTQRVQAEQRKAALQERLKQQTQSLIRLSTHPALAEGDLKRALPVITEMTSQTLDVARANIWQFSPEEYKLSCLDAFELSTGIHATGSIMQTDTYPTYFATLRSGIVLDVSHVQTDPRTNELTDNYWKPHSISATIEAPVRLHGQMTGLICAEHTGPPRTWTSDEVAFITQVADLVAQTFLNAEIHSRAERLAVVNKIARAVGATLQLDDLLEIVYHEIMAIFKSDAFFIALYDESHQELDFRIQVDQDVKSAPMRQPLGNELTAYVITEKRPLLIRDFEQERHNLPTPELWGTMRYPASWLGVPMQIGERVIGVVCVQAYEPYAYSKEEELLLSTIADQVAIAVKSARLYKTVQQELIERRRAEQERERLLAAEHEQRLLAETLAEVTLALTSRTRHEAVLDEILTQAQRIVPFKTANITLLQEDPVTQALNLYVARRQGYQAFNTDTHVATLVQPLSEFPIDAEAIYSRQPIIVFDTQQDPRWVQLEKTSWIRASLLVPICLRDRVLGLLRMDSNVPHAFSGRDAQRLQPLANAAAIAIENARLVEGLEAEVAARTSEIRTEKEKIETILRYVGDAILMVDAERRIQYINQGYTILTGYTLDDVRGKAANTIGAILSEKSEQLIQATLSKGELWQGEVVAQRKDGRTYDAALTIAPMYNADDQFIGYVASHRDISRSKELERARNRFITNVSHQFRTPVTTLRLQAYMMKQREPLQENLKYLAMMEKQIAQLDHLIQDVLDMAALDSGQVVQVWDPIDLMRAFNTLLAHYQNQAAASALTLHIQPPPADLPPIQGDQEHLTRALGEILENAIKFTPSGGQITIKTQSVKATADDKTWLTIAVQDTGPGIAPEEQEKVFDNFFRGNLAEAGHIPGTGLGLSLAQEIIHEHGGRVTVESNLGEGTTFMIWLPTRS